jgi:hypothetical protein
MGHFPLPTAAQIRTTPLPQLALALRTRLTSLRTPANAAAQLRLHRDARHNICVIPRRNRTNGWGMITSWAELRDAAGSFACPSAMTVGDEKRSEGKVAFQRPNVNYPFNLSVPNSAIPCSDGRGGLCADVYVLKGDWEGMWPGAGLGSL